MAGGGFDLGNTLLKSGENFALQQLISSIMPFAIPGLGLLVGWGLSGFKNPLHKPAQAQGTFGFSQSGGGWEDSAKVSDPTWGNLGFLDKGTQQFSGQGALPFDQQILGMLQKMTANATPDQISKIRTDLQGTNFGTNTGAYTTEGFLGRFGPQIANQIRGIVSRDLGGQTATPTTPQQATPQMNHPLQQLHRTIPQMNPSLQQLLRIATPR